MKSPPALDSTQEETASEDLSSVTMSSSEDISTSFDDEARTFARVLVWTFLSASPGLSLVSDNGRNSLTTSTLVKRGVSLFHGYVIRMAQSSLHSEPEETSQVAEPPSPNRAELETNVRIRYLLLRRLLTKI